MRKPSASGQILVELVIGAAAVFCFFIALIYVSGYGINGIKYLLASRRSAEVLGAAEAGSQYNSDNNADYDSYAGQNIVGWNYGDFYLDLTGDSSDPYHIPFTIHDSAVTDADIIGDSYNAALNTAVSNHFDIYSSKKHFIAANEVPIADAPHNFTVEMKYTDFYIRHAALVEGTGSYDGDIVYTLNTQRTTNSSINRTVFDDVMQNSFGMKSSLDPINIPANHVYLPILQLAK